MNKKIQTKEKILEKSLSLFNNYGVSNVSMRQIAKELVMSHSNLIYHFNSKNDLIESLHDQLLSRAVELNQAVKSVELDFINVLYKSTLQGFSILYEYRFFMLELNYIMRENQQLREVFLQVEKVRAEMYHNEIQKAIRLGILREESIENSYNFLIQHIKIFSDSWIASSRIYEDLSEVTLIHKYAVSFMFLFCPYLTTEGNILFSNWFNNLNNGIE